VTRPLLVFATSGPGAEVGLEAPRAGGPPHLEVLRLGAGAARGRELLPAVQRLLGAAGLAAGDLGGVLVDVGPGSFTGVRLGVTAAKSLAMALGLPAAGVGSLEALAEAAPPTERVIALRDAGRGTLYAARYGPADGHGQRPLEEEPQRCEARRLVQAPLDALLVGEEAPALARLHALPQRALALAAGAAAVLRLGRARLAQGALPPPRTLVPLYLQASAPERLRAGEPAGAAAPDANDRTKPVDG
jgi:tRNA threonylcarbamoyladenosine biosynthesis protein TsaB